MKTFFQYLPVVREIADVWATLTVGFVAGLACVAGAVFLPPVRQLMIGFAVACFASTWMLAVGVKQERDVWQARAVVAEKLRLERDAIQAKAAASDDARRVAGLNELNRREEESDDAYAKRIAALGPLGACVLTDDDLR